MNKENNKKRRIIISSAIVTSTVLILLLMFIVLRPAKYTFMIGNMIYEKKSIENIKTGLPTPNKDGYDFVNWYYNKDGIGRVVQLKSLPTKSFRENIELYAKFEPKTFNIYFYADNTNKSSSQIKVKYNNILPSVAIPQKDGHVFNGYYSKPNAEGEIYYNSFGKAVKIKDIQTGIFDQKNYTDLKNIKLYASFKPNFRDYNVIFLGKNGEELSSQKIQYGKNAKAPLPNKYPGYTFTGWNYDFNSVIRDLIITAQYEPKKYTLTLNAQDGEFEKGQSIKNVEIRFNETLSNLTLPTKTGSTFVGYFTDALLGVNIQTISYYKYPEDITIYARYKKDTYNIFFINDSNNSASQNVSKTIRYNEELPIDIVKPNKKGYKFIGYYDDEKNQYYDKDLNPLAKWNKDKSANLTAYYELIEYKLTYNLNANDAILPENTKVTYTYIDTFHLPIPLRKGYNFVSWLDENNHSISTLARNSSRDAILTAQWSLINYRINYQVGPFVNNFNNRTSYTVETDSFSLFNPSQTGYKFNYWNEGTGVLKGSTGNKTFSANYSIIDYKIEYKLNGGTNNDLNPSTYTVEDTVSLQDPIRKGYTFIGWNEGNFLSLEDVGNKIFTAKWRANDYLIQYELDGGVNNILNPTGYIINNSEIVIKPATKLGYNFIGWICNSSDHPIKNYTIAPNSTGNKKLKATYELTKFNITYILNESNDSVKAENNPSNPTTFTYIDTIILKDPIRKGYIFNGWAGLSDNVIKNEINNLTLVALWSLKNYTITYNLKETDVNSFYNIKQYNIEDKVVILYPSERNGYKFVNWINANGEILNSINPTNTHEDIVLNPVFEVINYNITYNNLDNIDISALPISYNIETETFAINNIEKNNHYFEGWISESDITPKRDFKVIKGNYGNLNLKAIFRENIYYIKFNKNRPKQLDNQLVTSNIEVLGTMTNQQHIYNRNSSLLVNKYLLSGHRFKGWSVDENSSKIDYTDGQVVTNLTFIDKSTINLYAQWEAIKYIIHYDYNNSAPIDGTKDSFTIYDKYTLPTQHRTGYNFVGWMDSSEKLITYIDYNTTKNITIRAMFNPKTYNIILFNDKSNITKNVKASYDLDMPTVSELNTLVEGYKFSGYFEKANGMGIKYYSSTMSSLSKWNRDEDNKTLHAYYIPNSYRLVFDKTQLLASGKNVLHIMDDQILKYGQKSALATNKFTLKGHKFIGWSLTNEGTKKYDNGQTIENLTSDNNATINLYPLFEKITYKIIFDRNKPLNASDTTEATNLEASYKYDDKIVLDNTKNPQLISGWEFKGWKFGNSVYHNTTVSELSIIEQTIVLKAVWEPKNVKVDFYNDLDTTPELLFSSIFTFDHPYPSIKTPIVLGYTFKGFEKRNGSINELIYDSNTNPINSTFNNISDLSVTKLYLKVEKNKYTVRFNSNKPQNATNNITGIMNDLVVNYDETRSILTNNFKLIGWRFDGWGLNKDLKIIDFIDGATIKKLSNKNLDIINFYAIWSPIKVNVSLVKIINPETNEKETQNLIATYDSYLNLENLESKSSKNFKFYGYFTEIDGHGDQYINENFESNKSWNIISDQVVNLYLYESLYIFIKDNNGDVVIQGISQGASISGTLIVPNKLVGSNVVKLDKKSFSALENLSINLASKIVLPNTIIEISEDAFADTKAIIDISATNLNKISARAFRAYKGNSITIPESVVAIEDEAFSNTSLKSIVISDNVLNIGTKVLLGSNNLEYITVPIVKNKPHDYFGYYFDSSLDSENKNKNIPRTIKRISTTPNSTEIPKSAYVYISADEFYISKNIKTIGIEAFQYGRGKIIFEYQSKLEKLERSAFQFFKSSNEIILPDSLKVIGYSAFYESVFSRIIVNSTVTDIYGDAFRDTIGFVEFKPNPDGHIVTAHYRAFATMRQSDFEIPKGLRKIPDSAFVGSDMEYVVIGDNITEIGEQGLTNTNFKVINIPKSITKVFENPFTGNEKLLRFEVHPDNPLFTSVDGVLYNKDVTELWAYPSQKTDKKFVIPSTVTKVLIFSITHNEHLREIVYPDSILDASSIRCDDCPNLEKITYPAKFSDVNTINNANGSKLKTYIIDEAYFYPYGSRILQSNLLGEVKVIGAAKESFSVVDGVLYNKDKTELIKYPPQKDDVEFRIPDSVTKIMQFAFKNAKKLHSIIFNNKLISIGGEAFSGSGITKMPPLPDTIVTIASNAFANNVFKEFTLPNNEININSLFYYMQVETLIFQKDTRFPSHLGKYGFDLGLFYVKNIVIHPENTHLKRVGPTIYTGDYKTLIWYDNKNNNLTEDTFALHHNTLYMSNNIFYGNRNIKKFIFNTKIITIPSYAFAYSQIETFVGMNRLPNLKYIYNSSFSNTILEKIYIPDTNENLLLYNSAFTDNLYLKEISISPKTVLSYAKNLFKNNIRLEKVIFRNPEKFSDYKLHDSTFENAVSLRNINLPKRISYFNKNVFANTGIKTLHIGGYTPHSKISLYNTTFKNADKLEYIYLHTSKASIYTPYKSTEIFSKKIKIIVPRAFYNTYINNKDFAPYTNQIYKDKLIIKYGTNIEGVEISDIQIKFNQIINLPTITHPKGYNFIGWYLDSDFYDIFVYTIPIKTDTVLYAKWDT